MTVSLIPTVMRYLVMDRVSGRSTDQCDCNNLKKILLFRNLRYYKALGYQVLVCIVKLLKESEMVTHLPVYRETMPLDQIVHLPLQ